MWFADFHVDGLRLDAVHALSDESETHICSRRWPSRWPRCRPHLRRPLTLIAESDLNDARMVTPREAGGLGIDAQWSDDFHHAVHVALTGETSGYYADFEPLARAGEGVRARLLPRRHLLLVPRSRPRRARSTPRTCRPGGWWSAARTTTRSATAPPATGSTASTSTRTSSSCAAMLTLAGPFTPMLFQGEEWAASTPFQFFTSHPEPDLGKATAEGRLTEFEQMGWDPAVVPDPQDPETFERSKLDWSEPESGRHARVLAAYQRLIELRRSLPALTDPSFDIGQLHRRRGVAGVHDATRRRADGRELRRPAGRGRRWTRTSTWCSVRRAGPRSPTAGSRCPRTPGHCSRRRPWSSPRPTGAAPAALP